MRDEKFFIQRLINGPVFLTGIMVLLFLWFLVTPTAGSQAQLNDADITDAVEDQLYRDRAVASQKIDVVTANGVVTLKGSVDNLLARERAARIAGIVKGVRSVVNRIIVYPAILRIDQQIRIDVHDALLSDPATDSSEIEIKVDDKTVILTGQVSSWREKMLCGKVAKRVKGVKALKNKLYVVKSKIWFDREIEAEI
ncbi:MAG: BON domain-containing protein, partial [Deltaproteobacteria bacterium]|nr:BON domain-containing protein [Deltaproteobacteria bacterium]